jgi:hypothetical protein
LKQERDQKNPHKISPTTHQAMHGVIKFHHDRIKRTNALSMLTTTLHCGGDRRRNTMLVATMEAVMASTTNTHQAMHGIIKDCHGRCRRTNAPPTASRTLHRGGDMWVDKPLMAKTEEVTTSTTNTNQAMHGAIEDHHDGCGRADSPLMSTTSTPTTHQATHVGIEDCHDRGGCVNAPPTETKTLHCGDDRWGNMPLVVMA